MSEIWWEDPPKNDTAGGFLRWKRSDDTFAQLNTGNQIQFCGWYTDNEDNKNECYYYHSFIKFPIPDIDNVESAEITVRIAHVAYTNIITEPGANYYTQVLTISSGYYPNYFPYRVLSENDMYMDTGEHGYWENIGNWRKFQDIFQDYQENDQHWLPLFDVTTEFNAVKNSELPYFPVRIISNYNAPYDWDNNTWLYNQELYFSFYGGRIGIGYNTSDVPSGFSEDTCMATPWLKIVYSGEAQWFPGEVNVVEEIACLASDYRSQSAIIGTTAGGLWRTWDSGANWSKIFEASSGILLSGEV